MYIHSPDVLVEKALNSISSFTDNVISQWATLMAMFYPISFLVWMVVMFIFLSAMWIGIEKLFPRRRV